MDAPRPAAERIGFTRIAPGTRVNTPRTPPNWRTLRAATATLRWQAAAQWVTVNQAPPPRVPLSGIVPAVAVLRAGRIILMRPTRTLLTGAAVAAVLAVGTPMAFADGAPTQDKNLTWQEKSENSGGDDEHKGGNEHKGSDEGRGNEGRGNEGRGNEGRGNEGRGNEGRGNEGRGNEGRGNEGRGNEGRGNEGRGNEGRGDEGRGNEGRGNEGRGNEGRGNEGRGEDNKSPHGGVHAGGGGTASTGGGLASGAVLLLGGLGVGAYALRRGRRTSGAVV
ncbi:hypothetical protein [Streptomyces sp. LS1784]|uniref:hypothetical protein n=1 Tax=Streptomyces sp. LS1784 TaxID=2851533 RepID=UPI001CCD3A9F|nr:hypothetical protein [Streptomyces sp. LS1784]